MGESTILGSDHTVMTHHSVHDHVSPQGKAHEFSSTNSSFENSKSIRLDVEGIDAKENNTNLAYPQPVIVNINTSMTINTPHPAPPQYASSEGNAYCNDKNVFNPGAYGSYSTSDSSKNLKQENLSSPSHNSLASTPESNPAFSPTHPYYPLQSFGHSNAFSHQYPCTNLPTYHQMPSTLAMQNTANLMSFNYSRNFNSPILPIASHTVPTKQPQTSYASKNSSNTSGSLNGRMGLNESQQSVDYPQQQAEVIDSSTNPPLYPSSNVIPHYPFHPHHPMHYPFYTYPTADMTGLPSSILPYCNNYPQYHLGRSQEDDTSTKQDDNNHETKVDGEKCAPFVNNVDTNLGIDISNTFESQLTAAAKPRKSSKCQCPNCTNRPKNASSKIVKKHACHWPNCGKTYGKTSHLKSHIRQHQGIRPFVCPTKTCMKSFTRSDELSRHVRIHTGEKRFNCSLCSKGFTRSDHLKKHEKTHRGNVGKNDTENSGKYESSGGKDKNSTKMSNINGIDDILKTGNNEPKNENKDFSNGESKMSVFNATQNNKLMMGRSGGIVMVRGDETPAEAQLNVFGATKKDDFGNMDEENQPFVPDNNQRYPLSNMSASSLGSDLNVGNRTNNPLQDITSYNRAYNPSNFVASSSYLKQEALNHNTTLSPSFQSIYPSYTTQYGQNRLMASNSISNNRAQLFDFKTNEC